MQGARHQIFFCWRKSRIKANATQSGDETPSDQKSSLPYLLHEHADADYLAISLRSFGFCCCARRIAPCSHTISYSSRRLSRLSSCAHQRMRVKMLLTPLIASGLSLINDNNELRLLRKSNETCRRIFLHRFRFAKRIDSNQRTQQINHMCNRTNSCQKSASIALPDARFH